MAVLIVDMINVFDFEGGERLKLRATSLVRPILGLREQMDRLGAPTIYVNDNFGEWHSEKARLVARARAVAPEIVEPLAPRQGDFFVVKPQLSGFYATNLPLLLPKLGVSRLVICGIAADICVLFTAADAHMRDYALWLPRDAVAAENDDKAQTALAIVASHLGGETASSTDLDICAWMRAFDEE